MKKAASALCACIKLFLCECDSGDYEKAAELYESGDYVEAMALFDQSEIIKTTESIFVDCTHWQWNE